MSTFEHSWFGGLHRQRFLWHRHDDWDRHSSPQNIGGSGRHFNYSFQVTFQILTSYFLFQPVLHDWCNKGCVMCNPVCGIVHIKEPLLLIGKSSPCGCSRFYLSLSEWSFTICVTPYNCK